MTYGDPDDMTSDGASPSQETQSIIDAEVRRLLEVGAWLYILARRGPDDMTSDGASPSQETQSIIDAEVRRLLEVGVCTH